MAFTLDSFHDHRNAFLFAVNPNGAEFDALVTDESPTLNTDWRGIWRVAARHHRRGWSAEFVIPFRSLRYPEGEAEQVWEAVLRGALLRKNVPALENRLTRGMGGETSGGVRSSSAGRR